MHSVWHKSSWRKSPLAPPYSLPADYPQTGEQLHQRSSRANNRFPKLRIQQRDWESPGNLTLKASEIWLQNFHWTGETDSWRTQTKCCVHQDPGERSSDPKRDWDRLSCECPRVSGEGVGQYWPAVGSRALNTTVLEAATCWYKSFWRRLPLLLLPLPYLGLRPNYREGIKPHPSTKNCIKDLLSMALIPLSEWDPDTPTASPSHQEASRSLLSFIIRGHTEWKPQLEKTNQTDHMDHSLV